MTSNDKEDIYDKYLQSEIMLYCLKKCISGRHLSPEIKVKILSLLYPCNVMFEDNSLESQSTTYSSTIKSITTSDATVCNNYKQDNNLLGIDEDIFDENPEKLTAEEQAQLKDCVLQELSLFHKFCTSVNSEVKVPSIDGNSDLLDNLEEQILKQTLLLENFADLQKRVSDMKVESCGALNEIIEGAFDEMRILKHTGSKIMEDIDKELMSGLKKNYFEKAETILENKIAKDKERIEQLKLELIELNI